METLQRQVRRAHRRLTAEHFLRVLSWSWFATLCAAAVLIGVDKYQPLGLEPWGWVAAALGVGLVVAGVWTWATRGSALEAAIEIDRRFGLKERVSSTWSLTKADLESKVAQALVDDAENRVNRLHVADKFQLRMDRWALLPLAPAAVAFLVALFLNPQDNPASATTQSAAQQKQIKKSAETLQKKLVDRRKEAREKGLKDAEDLFAKLEQSTRDLANQKMVDQKQALVKLSDLAKDLEKRRQELSAGDKLKDQLNQLKNFDKGPADKMAEALKQGDFQKASEELKKLMEDMKAGKLDKESQQKLAKQLSNLEEKLKQMAAANKQMQEELKQKIAQARAAGKAEEANKLEEQLAKLAQSAPQMKELDKLAQKLAQCSQCMKEGKGEQAMAAMSELAGQLSELKQQLAESEMLNEALSQLSECKDGMCQSLGMRPGSGMGRGRGAGERPEEETKTGLFNTQAKVKTGRGAAIITDFVDGPNIKGQVEQQIKTEFEAAKTADADPLTGHQLSRPQKDHAKEYFDSLREGK